MAATSTLKLVLDDKEYNASLKEASKGLRDFQQSVQNAGKSLSEVDDKVVEYTREIGNMTSTAKNSRGELREMTQTLTDLTIQYRGLTDEEKNTPFGQALSSSIDKLTQRASVVKDAMADVEQSIKGAASDTRTFDQLAQGMSVATASFQGLTGAGELLGIEMGNDVAVIAKLQSAMAVTNSLTTIQNALQKESALMMGISAAQTKAAAVAQTLLAKNTALAIAAGRAFNLVAKANPIGLLVTGIGLAAGALTIFSGKSKEAEEAEKKMAEAAKEAEEAEKSYREEIEKLRTSTEAKLYSTFVKLQASWDKLQTTAEKTQWIKDNASAFNELGVSIKSISDAEDVLVNNTQAMVEAIQLRARAAVLTRQIEKLLENGIDNPGSGEGFAPEGKYTIGFSVSKELVKELADVEVQLDEITKKWSNKNILGGGTTTKTAATQKELTETQQLQKNIEALTKEYQTLSDAEKVADSNMLIGIAGRKEAIKGEIQTNQQRIDELKRFADEAKNVLGKNQEAVFTINVDKEKLDSLKTAISGLDDKSIKVNVEPGEVELPEVPEQYTMTITADTDEAVRQIQALTGEKPTLKVKVELETGISGTNESAISEYIKNLQQELSAIDFSVAGSFQKAISLNGNIIDATTLSNLLKTSIQQGIDLAAAGIDTESLWEKIASGEGLEDADWEALAAKINEELKKNGIKLSIDTASGNVSATKNENSTVSKSLEKFNGIFSKLSSGVSSISSGIQSLGVKIPESIQSAINVLTGISSIISGIASILTIIEITTSAKAVPVIGTFLSHGGVVPHAEMGRLIPGNSFSGDNIFAGNAWVNSGELVLNRFQQQALAGTLENGGFKNISITGVLKGEDIVLSADRWGMRTGNGELLFAKNL
ncbi:MAG: hypothetical protein K6E67_10385 [Prevotella sp.]|nr:hypothetical protein [Prevotella sp.]